VVTEYEVGRAITAVFRGGETKEDSRKLAPVFPTIKVTYIYNGLATIQ
jgi:hypothetical protein